MVRISSLDALRGIAAVSVLLFHYTTRYDVTYGHESEPSVSVPAGYRGVDLFFIISGSVILMTLDRTHAARDFVVSRFSRLFPTYWAAMFTTYAVVVLTGLPGKQVSVPDLLLNVTMMPELLRARPVDGVYWTLEVELFFYVAMLVLFAAGLLRHLHVVLALWLGAALLSHALGYYGLGSSYLLSHLLILQYIPLFGAGMMLYRAHHDPATRLRSLLLWLLCMLSVALTERVDALVVALGGSAAVWLALRGRLSMLSHPLLVWLGAISYPLYLLHENIGFAIIRQAYEWGASTNVSIAAATLAALALAALFARFIEQPAMRWIRGWAARGRPMRLEPAAP
jgi:peptidoglycan/LPS O-acetylase OafA/YrhL